MKGLTKRQAIREGKRLWRPVLEGKARNKEEALELYPEFEKYKHMCPFCEYVHLFSEDCELCPLVQQTGYDCEDPDIDYIYHPKTFASVVMALRE